MVSALHYKTGLETDVPSVYGCLASTPHSLSLLRLSGHSEPEHRSQASGVHLGETGTPETPSLLQAPASLPTRSE